MGHCFSLIVAASKKKVNFYFFWGGGGKIRHGIGKEGGYFQLGMGPKFGP